MQAMVSEVLFFSARLGGVEEVKRPLHLSLDLGLMPKVDMCAGSANVVL